MLDLKSYEARAMRRCAAAAGLSAEPAPLVDREHHVPTCQWIEGDPPYGPGSYCGAPAVRGKSYCRKHLARMFDNRPRKEKKIWL